MKMYLLLVALAVFAQAKPSFGKLHGLTHSPLSMNILDQCVDRQVLMTNMELVAQHANNFRVYAIGSCPENTEAVLDFARERKLGVMLGIWISANQELNKVEMRAMRQFAKSHEDVIKAVIVGNEMIFVQKLGLKTVLKYMRRAKKQLKRMNVNLPVTTAEVWPLFEFNNTVGAALAKESDFICMQIQPFWEGFAVRCEDGPDAEEDCVDAGMHVENKAKEIEALYNKEVIICETGWPTLGERCCEGRDFSKDGFKAIPSEEGATKFIEDLVAATAKSGRPYYYHEAIDADWKRVWAPCTECEGLTPDFGCSPTRELTGCEVDYHFGLFTSNRVMKNITLPDTSTKMESDEVNEEGEQSATA